jgi:hypothetical protein
MTTHCSPGAGATTKQLVPNASAGNPATSTAALLPVDVLPRAR